MVMPGKPPNAKSADRPACKRRRFELWTAGSLERIVAKTPEEQAANLGLSTAAAKEWQVQRVLLKRLKEMPDGSHR